MRNDPMKPRKHSPARTHEERIDWWNSLPAVTQSMLRHTFNETAAAKYMRQAGCLPDRMELHGLYLMATGQI